MGAETIASTLVTAKGYIEAADSSLAAKAVEEVGWEDIEQQLTDAITALGGLHRALHKISRTVHGEQWSAEDGKDMLEGIVAESGSETVAEASMYAWQLEGAITGQAADIRGAAITVAELRNGITRLMVEKAPEISRLLASVGRHHNDVGLPATVTALGLIDAHLATITVTTE